MALATPLKCYIKSAPKWRIFNAYYPFGRATSRDRGRPTAPTCASSAPFRPTAARPAALPGGSEAVGPPAARRPADRRPAALPARPAAPRSATGPLVPVTRNAQRGHAHGSAPWSSGRAAAIVRKQPGAEHQPLALKQRRGRARRPAKIPCGRLFVRRRGRLDACCEPGGASKSNPPSPPA